MGKTVSIYIILILYTVINTVYVFDSINTLALFPKLKDIFIKQVFLG